MAQWAGPARVLSGGHHSAAAQLDEDRATLHVPLVALRCDSHGLQRSATKSNARNRADLHVERVSEGPHRHLPSLRNRRPMRRRGEGANRALDGGRDGRWRETERCGWKMRRV
jgi:hypothetical protein